MWNARNDRASETAPQQFCNFFFALKRKKRTDVSSLLIYKENNLPYLTLFGN